MIDVVKIKVKAGNGGDGKVSFRREKFIPKGGPDGGDGGAGGSIYLYANHNMATLIDFRSKPKFIAQSGKDGGGKQIYGEGASDLIIDVPVGTLVYEIKEEHEILVCDLSTPDQKYLIAKGGRGGKGNFRFRSSTNQVPMQFTYGTKGEEKDLKLEIKLVADVGLLGAPNAGKSTLLNKLTNTNVKVANYPFTTLFPNLGVCKLKDKSIVIADIPGLIEGASKGKGLGDEFLRHIERTRVLVHLVDPLPAQFVEEVGDSEKIAKLLINASLTNYKMIMEELKSYNEVLLKKPQIVVINKLDVTEVAGSFLKIKNAFKRKGVTILGISAFTGEGIDALKKRLLEILNNTLVEKIVFEPEKSVKTYTIDNLPNKRIVFK